MYNANTFEEALATTDRVDEYDLDLVNDCTVQGHPLDFLSDAVDKEQLARLVVREALVARLTTADNVDDSLADHIASVCDGMLLEIALNFPALVQNVASIGERLGLWKKPSSALLLEACEGGCAANAWAMLDSQGQTMLAENFDELNG